MDTSEVDSHARLGARVSGAMMLAGGVLGAVSVALPPRASGSDAIVLILVAMGAVLGVVLLRSRSGLPEWLLGLAIATGTALITLATLEGGAANTGTDDNEMLYVWICLLAFNFLSFRHALGQLALVAAAYALLLTDTPLGEAATRWLISIATLLVAGMLVHHLRSSRDRLVAELSERATTDSLTGLLNRAALEERAVLELARVRRDGAPLSLMLLDVDNLKSVNDTSGHPAGDALLREIAAGLREHTRQIDALARVGGDEFAVLLPGASGEDGVAVARRLARVESEAGATVSIGIATTTTGRETFETLLARGRLGDVCDQASRRRRGAGRHAGRRRRALRRRRRPGLNRTDKPLPGRQTCFRDLRRSLRSPVCPCAARSPCSESGGSGSASTTPGSSSCSW